MRYALAAVTLATLVGGARAAAPAAPAAPDAAVAVAPFAPLGDAAQAASWIGPAIQQCTVNELLRGRLANVVAIPAQQRVDNAAAAAAAARQHSAQAAVWGTYQVNGAELRIIGQLVDARDGRPLAAMKATGAMRDLFGLEDSIAQQARRAVMELSGRKPAPVEIAIPAAIQQMAGVPGAFAVRPSGPLRDEALLAAEFEREMRRLALDREYYSSHRRYGLLWGPVYYYPVTSYVPFTTYGRSYRAWGPTLRFSGTYTGQNTFIRFGGGM